MVSPGLCRECGAALTARRATAQFCDDQCRGIFHKRKATRGALAYDFLMAWRFEREVFENAGGRNLLGRLAAAFRAEDERDRAGRKSWDDPRKAKERSAHIFATLVATNVAGVRKRNADKHKIRVLS
jgi:hypothetical protein